MVINLIRSGYDPVTDQNFIELIALGDFEGYSNIMLGFTNPSIESSLKGPGGSSILNASIMTETDRIDKFYFNKHINNIDVKNVFLEGSTVSEEQSNQMINFSNILI